jgi:RNA polymerase sigma factor (sigma-70 family)
MAEVEALATGRNGRPSPLRYRLRRQLDDLTSEIVEANRGLVRSYVMRFTSNASPDDAREFESAGILGLMHAIATYRVGKGTFAHWAYRRIQCEVLNAVRATDHPTMSAGDFMKRPAILQADRQLRDGGEGYIASYGEIAAAAEATVNQVRRVLEAPSILSLATPIGDDARSTTLDEMVPDPTIDIDSEVMAKIGMEALMAHGLSCLDARELFVIVRRFGLDNERLQLLREIGELMGLSRETVRQLEINSVAKMRQHMIAE